MTTTHRARELRNNAIAQRGTVTARDGENHRIRVQVPHEDGVPSFWIDVIGRGASANASFDMPDEGDEVWFVRDAAGESGVYLGTRYNTVDRPPTTDPDVSRQNRRDGSYDAHDPSSGTRTIHVTGTLVLHAGGTTVTISEAGVMIEGGEVRHNGANIGDTHVHGDVLNGPSTTSEPVN